MITLPKILFESSVNDVGYTQAYALPDSVVYLYASKEGQI